MTDVDRAALLQETAAKVTAYREQLSELAVSPKASSDELRSALGGPLPQAPTPANEVVDQLATGAEPGLVATTGPRYFGFVVGGSLDAAMCADILAAGWDQNAGLPVLSPAAAVAEEIAGEWVKDLLNIPADATFGFTTGGQASNTVGLVAARHRVLADAGWNVETQGLIGAPPITVIAGAERHVTIDRALRFLGIGTAAIQAVPTDANGAVDQAQLERAIADADGPTIVCLQAGNVNTGAFDNLARGCQAAHEHGAWVHVDGAFGLWAAASPSTQHLVEGVELADSWATDAHKWLNVPYDSGLVFCADASTHEAATSAGASYLAAPGNTEARTPFHYVTEASRRARGFAVWAALRQLGRDGVADLVERSCALARQFAKGLSAAPGFTIANDVVLNQVLVRFGDDDDLTDRLMAEIQRDGTCWMGGTTWHGHRYMRISVSNWSTRPDDVDRSVAAVIRAAEKLVGPRASSLR